MTDSPRSRSRIEAVGSMGMSCDTLNGLGASITEAAQRKSPSFARSATERGAITHFSVSPLSGLRKNKPGDIPSQNPCSSASQAVSPPNRCRREMIVVGIVGAGASENIPRTELLKLSHPEGWATTGGGVDSNFNIGTTSLHWLPVVSQ